MDKLFRIKNVANVIDMYSITKDGRVYGHQRQRYLKGTLNSVGYHMYSLKLNNGLFKWFSAHRLVALTFEIPKKHDKQNEVNHIDGDKLNNNVNNLEWVTHSENVLKSYITGRKDMKGIKKKPHSEHAKILMSNAKKRRIKVFIHNVFYKTYESIGECCNDLGISRHTVNRTMNNKYKKPRKYTFEIIPD